MFAELSKFKQTENERGTVLERGFYFLKHAGDLSAIPEVLATEPALAPAFEIANSANLSVEEWDAQERREMFIQDPRGSIELAEAKGRVAGSRRLFTSLLAQRFGSIPQKYQERLSHASQNQLDLWGLRTLGAQALDDIF